MQSIKKNARLAGILYLIVIICGIFAEKYVRASLVDLSDGPGTLENILQNEMVFRLGFVSDLMMQLAFFLLPLVLYRFLADTDPWLAHLMVLSVSVSVAIMCINMLNHYAPLVFLNRLDLTSVRIENTVLVFLDLHNKGYHIAQIFFGLWLLPLGSLIIKSGLIPKFIGILLIMGGGGYLIDFICYFLFPGQYQSFSGYFTVPADLGEFSLCLYLLLVGVRSKEGNKEMVKNTLEV